MNGFTQITADNIITIAGADIPVTVEQESDGWWIARGRLGRLHPEHAAASRFDAHSAVDRLREKLTRWSN